VKDYEGNIFFLCITDESKALVAVHYTAKEGQCRFSAEFKGCSCSVHY